MKKLFIISIGIVALLALCSPKLWSANYYVKSGGNDESAGTSDGAAWAKCPGMAGWTGSATLSSGDTVYFNAQDTWTSDSTTAALLTAVSGVTYDGATYGTGARLRATFQLAAGFTGGASNFMVKLHGNTVVFKGFEIDGNHLNATGLSYGTGSTVDIDGLTIDNCMVHSVGNPATSGVWMYGILIGATTTKRVSNIQILNTDVYDCYREGIAIYPSWGSANIGAQIDTVLVQYCNTYSNGTAPTLNGMGIAVNNNSDNVTIEHCNIYNQTHGGTGAGYGMSIRTSPDGSVAVGAPNNLIVRYNRIYGNDGDGISLLANYNPSMTVSIYNNIIYDNVVDVEISSGNWSDSVINIYNNTITNTTNVPIWAAVYGLNIYGTPTFNFKNNIVYTTGANCVYDRHAVLTHSNNLIYRADNSSSTAVSSPVYSTTAVSSVAVTVSAEGSYIRFTKTGGTDWTTLFSVGNFVKWTGFSSGYLNNSLFYIYAVNADYIEVYEDGINDYTDVNTVTGEKWIANTCNRATTITTWEATAQNTDPLLDANYNIGYSSPAKGNGTNLSTIFTTDMYEAYRSGSWCIGAHHYRQGVTATMGCGAH